MSLDDLPEINRLPSGQLKGPQVGTFWGMKSSIWVVESVSRPDPDQRVNMVKIYGAGPITTHMSVAEFWSNVMNKRLWLVVHLTGIEAVKRAVST